MIFLYFLCNRTIPVVCMGVKLGISVLRNTYFREECKRICEENREVVRGEWRKLHNEEINTLFFLQNIIML